MRREVLLPLMLQPGFGLRPLQSGRIAFVSAVGAMFMKTPTSWLFRRFGFRPTLIAAAVIS